MSNNGKSRAKSSTPKRSTTRSRSSVDRTINAVADRMDNEAVANAGRSNHVDTGGETVPPLVRGRHDAGISLDDPNSTF